MKVELRDTAFTMRIHIGMLRDGNAFLETDIVENVLGDVAHRKCMGAVAQIAYLFLIEFMKDHFGDEITPQEKPIEEDDLISFFDKARDIDG